MDLNVKFEIEFFSPTEKIPCIVTSVNGKLMYEGEAKNFDLNFDVEERQKYTITIKGTNITEENKKIGEFGFKVKKFSINGIEFEWFDYVASTHNPGLSIPMLYDKNANYINMPHGQWNFTFKTPIPLFCYDLHQKWIKSTLDKSIRRGSTRDSNA